MRDSYFKCYPSDFLAGVLGMGADEIGAYAVILMMIYDRGGPIPEDSESLAWRCRMNVRRFKNVVDRLVSSEKLTRCDGKLSNERAERELLARRHFSEKQSSCAQARWSKPEDKLNKINDPPMPPQDDGNPLQNQNIGSVNPSLRSGLPSLLSETSSDAKVKSKKRTRRKPDYTAEFLNFWQGYPTDANMSKAEAFEVWQQLDDEDRRLAMDALPKFVAYCETHPDYRPIHAIRFLSKRRFEGHAETAKRTSAAASIFLKAESREWQAWDTHLRRATGKGAQVSPKHGGWWFPSKYPPEGEQAA